ncbi:hypothetical protein [Moraxella lacunata]
MKKCYALHSWRSRQAIKETEFLTSLGRMVSVVKLNFVSCI